MVFFIESALYGLNKKATVARWLFLPNLPGPYTFEANKTGYPKKSNTDVANCGKNNELNGNHYNKMFHVAFLLKLRPLYFPASQCLHMMAKSPRSTSQSPSKSPA